MTASGCTYTGGICRETVEACGGCNRKKAYGEGWFCSACPEPEVKWKSGFCNMATHMTRAQADNKQKINPLKASKRASR